ncbi:hypothetical protein CHISP_1599 [Chitinispirillum alkaliphilum]|nr:hypothetical protein CHISP_1599 [Chitinispirillum alkaliphilum]
MKLIFAQLFNFLNRYKTPTCRSARIIRQKVSPNDELLFFFSRLKLFYCILFSELYNKKQRLFRALFTQHLFVRILKCES